MKLQLREGAFYLFDDGSVAGPAAKTKHPNPCTWVIAGNYYDNSGRNEAWPYRPQIVGEVTITPVALPEPKRKVVWINFYGDIWSVAFKSRQAADAADKQVLSTLSRIACQKFELIEGIYDAE